MSIAGRFGAFRDRHRRQEGLLFFAGGFLFDALLLKRIDEPAMLIQQGAYLVAIGVLLSLVQYHHLAKQPATERPRAWNFIDHLIHFMMGTLLNGYSIFYFHSASGLTAVGLLGMVAVLLAVNELPQFHDRGPVVMSALYGVCLTSYFAYLVPVLEGHLSRWMFYSAVVLSLGPLSLQTAALWRWTHDWPTVIKQSLGPVLLVQAGFVLAFALRLAPPVPLAVKEMGIYHGVKREPDGRRLFRERPTWRFWEKGDQDFLERPGDRVFCFARIFAPRHFSDRLNVLWFHDTPKQGWRKVYEMPLAIAASSDRGFATEAYLTSPPAGSWRVELQTEDGYTVGQLSFEVRLDSGTEPRTFTEEFSPTVPDRVGQTHPPAADADVPR